jgi:hypothetical protein
MPTLRPNAEVDGTLAVESRADLACQGGCVEGLLQELGVAGHDPALAEEVGAVAFGSVQNVENDPALGDPGFRDPLFGRRAVLAPRPCGGVAFLARRRRNRLHR